MIVLGSGGHTAEMLLMLEDAKIQKWRRRSWVVSGGDAFSSGLAADFESKLSQNDGSEKSGAGNFGVVELPRARRVHQSIFTAPITSIICLWSALKMLRTDAPDIILTNGPGTGVIVVLASLVLRFFAIGQSWKTRCIYIESLARCKKLSLSGRLLKPLVDRFLVQWKELEDGKAEFRGCFALDAAVGVGMESVEDEEVIDKSGWITYDL
jgi:beta-1,4-N-acetylglucosaminyltransferase